MLLRRFSLALVLLSIGCGGKVGVAPGDAGDDTTADTSEPPLDSARFDEGIRDTDLPPPFDAGPPTPTSKLDLLFVIDNSISMADKQSELARAIPLMIRKLVDPTADPSGKAFTSVNVGVITSSLGSHGTSACAVEITNRANNDKAYLLPRTGEGGGTGFAVGSGDTVVSASCPAPVTASPLSWVFDPAMGSADFSGAAGGVQLGTAASCVIQSAKEQGCGYEASLEAMYRFLIDPAPYASADVRCTFGISGDACGSNKIEVTGVDSTILAQRAAFLRPDSTVVIVNLSDENDFSLKPAGLNWLPWGYGKGQMQHGWSACKSVPDSFEPETAGDYNRLHNDFGCWSCFEKGEDPECRVPWPTDPLNKDVDGRNLRGFHQVQRFGYNFLWGRQRYVDGLTKSMVFGSDNKLAPNPLFAGGRSSGNVIFAAIVGVPNNLVTNSDGTAKTLTAVDWQKIVGDTGRDPHMLESIAPRAGLPKYAGNRAIDPVSGGERDQYDGDDLQYACIAPRTTTGGTSYECEGTSPASRSPLCNSDGTQAYYKAYPGLRQLRVAQAVNGYAASICNPRLGGALDGLVARLRPLIK